jgi:hypothetical protein
LVVLQVSPVPHGAQLAPAVPHEVGDSDAHGWHVPLAVQQPIGHEVASHTHVPLVVSHSWPLGHAAHWAPPAPHDVVDSAEYASHVPELQQPAVHGLPPQLQLPAVQVLPFEHMPQSTPPVPHALVD